MLNKSLINKTYPPIIFDVEKQRVKFFADKKAFKYWSQEIKRLAKE